MPHLLESGDVVELSIPSGSHGKVIETRRCKIIEIGEADAFYKRASTVEWLDTGERERKLWQAAKGIHQPLWVVDGPKLKAALRREAKVRRNDMGRWLWEGYAEEMVGV